MESYNFTRRKSIMLQLCTLIIIILAVAINVSTADRDWVKECGVCHCKWISSKKQADCKNTSLTAVPIEMSVELQVIDLSLNIIPELRRTEFKDANLPNLHKVFMRNCTLQEIHKDAFKGLELLIELDLSNNYLKVLQPGVFSDVLRLRVLILNFNLIERLEDYLFDNLTFFTKLELKNNQLRYIGPKTFVDVPKLSEIYLESNKLSILSDESFRYLPKLRSLSLMENPWNCTCELQQFQRFVTNQSLYTPPTSCYEPKELHGKLWNEIPPEDFACRPKILQPINGAVIDAHHDNVTMVCRMKASPKPEITWTYNGRPTNALDQRISIKYTQQMNRNDPIDIYSSELSIVNVKLSDKGSYICTASNTGGTASVEIVLNVPPIIVKTGEGITGSVPPDNSNNFLLLLCMIAITFLALLIVIVLILCCYCRRVKKYSKNGSISENGLVPNKIDKSQDGSMLEGSVIMEMQKSLLTDVNPVEKPPRRTELDGNGELMEDGFELKKTLLDASSLGNHDDETHSVALSDTTPRSRATFVDDGYGTNLPPDLLAFPSRFPQSPSAQSSISNIPDGHLYMKSPASSPIYQHNPYMGPGSGFRTLQHPKNRNINIINRNQSPFTPAPILYAPVVMKQGYVTIPRKPRTPSWAPSIASTMIDFPPTSPTSTISTELAMEPVYDNLGLRTTAGGNSVLSLNKLGMHPAAAAAAAAAKYTMKDRPLPATPLVYHPIHETQMPVGELSAVTHDDTELLFQKTNEPQPTIVSAASNGSNSQEKTAKVPPRPPPKPKKKQNAATITEGSAEDSTSQLFQDECEDGTEV